MTAEYAYKQALKAKNRMPELEPIILTHVVYSCMYAFDIIQGRWIEAEPAIMQNGYWAVKYAREILKCRWLEAEPSIIRDAKYSYLYARDVIKERWLEAEPIIIKGTDSAYFYTRDVIQMRWFEAEKIIAQSKHKDDYIQDFFGSEPTITKDEVDIIFWQRKNAQGYFAPASWFEDKVSLLDVMVKE